MFQQYLLFQHQRESTLALVFPALNARRRFLIHHTVQEDFPNLATFSVGEDESRRTVVTTPEVLKEQEQSKQGQEQTKQKPQRQHTPSPAPRRDNSRNQKSQGLPNGKVGEGRGQVQQAGKDPPVVDATGGRDSPSSGTSRRRKRARRRKSSRDSRSRSKDSSHPQTHNKTDAYAPKLVVANNHHSQSRERTDNKCGVGNGIEEKRGYSKTNSNNYKSEIIVNNRSHNSNSKPVQNQGRSNNSGSNNNPNSAIIKSVQSNGIHVLRSGRCVSESDAVDVPPSRSCSSKGGEPSAINRVTGKAAHTSGKCGGAQPEGSSSPQPRIKGRQPSKQASLDSSTLYNRENTYHNNQRWCGGPSGGSGASPSSRGSSSRSNNASPVRMIATQHQPEINITSHRRRGKAAAQIYRPPPARCNGTEIMGPQPEAHISHNMGGGDTSQNRQRGKRPDQQLYRPGASRRPAQQLYVPRGRRIPTDSPSARVTPTPGEHDHPPRPPSPAYSVSSIVSEFGGRNRYGQDSRQGSQLSLYDDDDIYGKSPNQKGDFSRESTPGQCKQNNRFSNQTMQLLERCINRDANAPNNYNNRLESESINNSPSKSNKNSRSRRGRKTGNNEDLIEKSPTPTRDVHSKENLMHPVEQNSRPRKGRRNRGRNSRSREGSIDKVFNGVDCNDIENNGIGDRGFGSCERVFYNTTLVNQPNQERHDRGYDNYDRYTSSRNSSVASSRNNSRERTPNFVSSHNGSPQYGVPHFTPSPQPNSNGNWRDRGSSNPNSPQKSPLSRQNSGNKPPSGRLGSLPNVALNLSDNRRSLEVCSDNWRSLDSSTDTRRSMENNMEETHKYPKSRTPLKQGSPSRRLSQDNGDSKLLVNSHTAIASVIDAAHRLQEIAMKESQTTTATTSYSPISHSSPINTPNYSPNHSPKNSPYQSPSHSCINSSSHSPLQSPTSTSNSFTYTNTGTDTMSNTTTSAHSSNSSHSYSNEEPVADSLNSIAYKSIPLHSTNSLDETLVNGEVSSTETTVENVPEVSMDINGSNGTNENCKTSSDHEKDEKKNPKKFSFNWADEVEDSWDTLFDDSGECVDPNVITQLNDSVGKIKLEKPANDYYSFNPKESSPVQMNDDEYAHVIEIFDFPVSFKTQDLMSIFSAYNNTGFDIKWVDDTHALGVFATTLIATEALNLDHPFLKTRPLSLATAASKAKALRITEALLPYKPRPTTCANLARRLVSQSLGLRVNIPKEVREAERQKLKDAKARKKLVAKQRVDAWEGTLA